MNSFNILNNILRIATNSGLTAPSNVLLQQTRNTFILKRRTPPPLHKKNGAPHRLRRRNYIYDLVENTDVTPRKPLKIILTKTVEGVGSPGDIIFQPPMRAYNNFLLPGLAVYASPDNLEKYKVRDDTEEKKKDHFMNRTLEKLKTFLLNVIMSADNPWTLEKWHIRAAFRKTGIYLNDDCIVMPERPISGPNFTIENKEFYITVIINKTNEVIVRCRIHHWSHDPLKQIPVVHDFYKKMSEPIYPEDKSVLDSLPIPYSVQKAMDENEQNETE